MTVDLPFIAMLVAVSCTVAIVLDIVKEVVTEAFPGIKAHPAKRIGVRLAAVLLGIGLVKMTMGPGWVQVCLGVLAGASSEVVYRWLLVDVIQAVGRRLG